MIGIETFVVDLNGAVQLDGASFAIKPTKMKRIALPLIFLVFSLLWLGKTCIAQSGTAEVHKETLQQLLEDYYTTMSARNWNAYRSFFWNKATLTTTWAGTEIPDPEVHVSTIDEFIAQTPEGPDSEPIFEEKMLGAEVEVRGSLALAWVSYEAKFGSKEKLTEWTGTDLFTFMHFRGEWKIVALAFESDATE